MRFLAFICALLLGATGLVGTTGAARAYEQDRISVGAWEGGAYFDDKMSVFKHCAVSAVYRNGVDVILLYSEDGLSVGFAEKSWDLKPGEQYDFDLRIDNRWSKRVTGSVPFDGGIRVDLGTDERAIAAFRFGNLLTLQARSGTFQFGLERTSAAIAALYDCYVAHARPNDTNPFAGSPGIPFAGTANADATEQGTGSPWRISPPGMTLEQFRQIMQSSLGNGAVTESVAKGSEGDFADYLVTDGTVVGAFWQEDSRTRTPDQVVANFTGSLQQECRGSAASSITSRYSKNEYEIRGGFAACRDQDNTITYTALTVVSANGRANIFVFFPIEEKLTDQAQADVDQANESVRHFLVELVSKGTL